MVLQLSLSPQMNIVNCISQFLLSRSIESGSTLCPCPHRDIIQNTTIQSLISIHISANGASTKMRAYAHLASGQSVSKAGREVRTMPSRGHGWHHGSFPIPPPPHSHSISMFTWRLPHFKCHSRPIILKWECVIKLSEEAGSTWRNITVVMSVSILMNNNFCKHVWPHLCCCFKIDSDDLLCDTTVFSLAVQKL